MKPSEPDSSPKQLPSTLAEVIQLREANLSKRPVIKNILEKYGSRSVFRYIKEYIATPLPAANTARQEEFITAFKAEVEPRLGKASAERGAKQLRKYYYLSTTDHFGPMYHPWVFNFNILSAAACRESDDEDLTAVITLACSNVSLNNFSFPRGLKFTTPGSDGKAQLNRLAFLPSNAHSYPVYNFRSYGLVDIEKIKKLLPEQIGSIPHATIVKEKLFSLLDTIYASPDVLSAKNYADQVSLTNQKLWQELQCDCTDHKQIDFIYIEQERVVSRLLVAHHLHAHSPIGARLFDPSAAARFLEIFDQVPEAFDKNAHTGTYLFWYLPPSDKHRVRLLYTEKALVSEDGTVSIPLTAEAITQGLEKGELIPSVLLTFLLMYCYYGVTCLGGMGQTGYLPQIQAAWLKLMNSEQRSAEVDICQKLNGSLLGGEMTVAYIDSLSGVFAPATSLDLILYGNDDARACIIGQAKSITLSEAMDPNWPDDYPMHFKATDQNPRLAKITGEDIAKLTGLADRISPCIHLDCQIYH